MSRTCLGCLLALLLASPPAFAATPQSAPATGNTSEDGDGETEEEDAAYLAEVQAISGKKMTATFTNAPPVIDGSLNDPEWSFAEPVTDFLQREPDNGQPGSERTEVRILYDEENIYIAFMMYDREPDRIVATDLRRDSRLDTDDTIAVIFDTYHDRRNGYLFRVNALGTKHDAEVRNERQVNADWDERWEAAARISDQGWIAEFSIPFKVLRFNTGSHVWGIDFKRDISRRNEEINWSNYRRGFMFNSVSQAGNLVGLRNLGLTERFRFQPYITGSGSQFNVSEEPRNELDGSLGIEDFKIQLTPNLTADLTVNTDFAQVEDDSERVNLSRFPLFFPEKREFFLESANNFNFGSGGGGRGGGFGGPDVSLYHSRNIGLVDGEPVPIIYGAKMTGKVGSTDLGFLNAQTDTKLDATGQNFTVVRLKQDIFERSSVGMIYTNAQGGGRFNRVAGVDASFRFYDYLGISADIASVIGDDDIEGNPLTGRFGAGWNSDTIDISGSYQRIDPEFDTDLGFIRRRNVAEQSYRVGYSPRPAWAPAIRQLNTSVSVNYVTDIEGNLLTREQNFMATANLQSGDRLTFNYGINFERLDDTFWVSSEENIFVPPGDYTYNDWSINLMTYNARTISGRINYSSGEYWNGTKRTISPGGTIRFSEKLSVSPSWSFNHVELPTGTYDTQTVTGRMSYNFNERWLTNSLVQYNSVSGRLSVYARLRFVINEIDSFYLVYKSATVWDELYPGVSDHQLIAKTTYSIDF